MNLKDKTLFITGSSGDTAAKVDILLTDAKAVAANFADSLKGEKK